MAVPFYSIDIKPQEILSMLKCVVLPFETKDKKDLLEHINDNFPLRKILILPSARMAFYLTLQAKFNRGDEIIFPVLGFPLYVKIARQLGLNVKFVDVEPLNLNIDPKKLREKISSNTKAIVVTHLFGHPAKLKEIINIAKQHNIFVIEDCAQSYDSKFEGNPTGIWGDVGIFSCSLMKVPTTLGGGIFITKDNDLCNKISAQLSSNKFSNSIKDRFPYFVKNSISILNSFPFLYTILSHHIFGILKKRNPLLLRRILYSGMGMNGNEFNLWERPKLSSYQLNFGFKQFSRTQVMTNKRRLNSKIIDQHLFGIPNVKIFLESKNVYWNYQYHVIEIKECMNTVYKKMFDKGFHLMKEDVWDCTKYDFTYDNEHFPIGTGANKGLIRIPNNSLLSETTIIRISTHLKEVCQSL